MILNFVDVLFVILIFMIIHLIYLSIYLCDVLFIAKFILSFCSYKYLICLSFIETTIICYWISQNNLFIMVLSLNNLTFLLLLLLIPIIISHIHIHIVVESIINYQMYLRNYCVVLCF